MALNPNELFASNTVSALKRVEAKTIQPKTFASGSGTLAQLTPIAFNTSTGFWVPWTDGGANGTGTISGFVWPDEVVLDSDDEVMGNVLLEGKVHYDDIALPSGETEANLKTALRDGPRGLGLIIQGLDQVR